MNPQQLQTEIHVIRQSGLLLPGWYIGQHRELAGRGGDGVEHFCTLGWRQGARPNPYFDTAWYLAQNPEVASAGVNPLLHYIAFGEAEGRNPSPWFDVAWYRAAQGLGPKEPCLRHFLERRGTGEVSPVPEFDAGYYLAQNPDVAQSGIDPFEHFCLFGAKEGRNPSARFDVKFYQNRYEAQLKGQNPLLHFLANRAIRPGLATNSAEDEVLVAAMVRRATRPGPHFEEFQPVSPWAPRRAKLLAYYLPQFHRVVENDAWWGKGFTDWTNLMRASPRFAGHQQPRVPRDLGVYSLDDPETLRRQVAMAKAAGLEGFVFYTYWFNRHRLLEKPLEQFLAEPGLDISFCAMWANENWTRRWDGMEHEVLIAQEYRDSDDAALIAHFARLFADQRYIRIETRPLLMIYRAGLIPDTRARIRRWREMFRAGHGEDPLIIMAQSLGEDYDPTPYGLDGAVEFPPHKISQAAPRIEAGLTLLDPDFNATVHDYAAFAQTALALPTPAYPLIRTAAPGWDNDPRREGKGLVLHGATPALYQDWLEKLIADSAAHPFHGERIVCINAWNEWAEGAYLEPDLYSGAAYLNATARAVCEETAGAAGGILLVGHDAEPHGAQLLLLHIARHLRRRHGFRVQLMLLRAGPLLDHYAQEAEVKVMSDTAVQARLFAQYRAAGLRHAIVNTAAAADVVPRLARAGIAASLLVHELPQLLREHRLEAPARRGAEAARQVVFSSAFARARFSAAIDLALPEAPVLAQGNYQAIGFDAQARARCRKALGLGAKQFLVLGAGYAHLRKGFDLFLQMARKFARARDDVRFVWVGNIESTLQAYLGPEMAAATQEGGFTHVAFTDTVSDYFAAADVFALPSREDPLPTVVMEALAAGVPCVAFDESGGIPELLRETNAGSVVPMGDVDAFAAALAARLDHRKLDKQRPALAALAARRFDFPAYVERLLALTAPELPRVSAVVLNYNYARYLPERLNSIFDQTHPLTELLLLDDASRDDSLAVARVVARAAGREMTVIANEANAGVFAQWRRAAELATGDWVWLCEADDAADPDMLAKLVAACTAADDVLLGFTDSRAMDEDGQPVSASYKSYYLDAGATGLLASGLWPGRVFAAECLATRNLILNVSAVLWRRTALRAALDAVPDLAEWQLAGDWRLYLAALTAQPGQLAYVAEPLNLHRRHAGGVTRRLSPKAHLAEIARMQALAAATLKLGKPARAAQAADLARVAAQLQVRDADASEKTKAKNRETRTMSGTKATKAVARRGRV